MYKLVVLIGLQEGWSTFDQGWPEFLKHAENMPGLLRESSSHVDRRLAGELPVTRIHEFFFESHEAALQAMASAEGQAAGRVLQRITGGKVTLLLANHHEDDAENLRRYRQEAAG